MKPLNELKVKVITARGESFKGYPEIEVEDRIKAFENNLMATIKYRQVSEQVVVKNILRMHKELFGDYNNKNG